MDRVSYTLSTRRAARRARWVAPSHHDTCPLCRHKHRPADAARRPDHGSLGNQGSHAVVKSAAIAQRAKRCQAGRLSGNRGTCGRTRALSLAITDFITQFNAHQKRMPKFVDFFCRLKKVLSGACRLVPLRYHIDSKYLEKKSTKIKFRASATDPLLPPCVGLREAHTQANAWRQRARR